MKFSENQITKHARNDSAVRLALIGATLGFGDVVLRERYSPTKESWSCFMDSGAMLIWSKDHSKLVTGFVPSKEQVMWVYGRPLNKFVQKLVENATKKYQRGLA